MADKAQMRDVTLPSGAVATIAPYTGRTVMQAQRIYSQGKLNDDGLIMPIIMQLTVLVDGEGRTYDEFLDLPGTDYMTLLAELGNS